MPLRKRRVINGTRSLFFPARSSGCSVRCLYKLLGSEVKTRRRLHFARSTSLIKKPREQLVSLGEPSRYWRDTRDELSANGLDYLLRVDLSHLVYQNGGIIP